MSDLVYPVTRYRVTITRTVEAKIEATTTVTDAAIREYYDIPGNDPIDPELIEEYVCEEVDESFYELHDVTDWDRRSPDVVIVATAKEMHAPPEFVPLPGMEGDLST